MGLREHFLLAPGQRRGGGCVAWRTGPETFLRIPCAATEMVLGSASWGCRALGPREGCRGRNPSLFSPWLFPAVSDILPQLRNNFLHARSHLGAELGRWLPTVLFLSAPTFPEKNLGPDVVTRSICC